MNPQLWRAGSVAIPPPRSWPRNQERRHPQPPHAKMIGNSTYEGYVIFELALGKGTRKLGFTFSCSAPPPIFPRPSSSPMLIAKVLFIGLLSPAATGMQLQPRTRLSRSTPHRHSMMANRSFEFPPSSPSHEINRH